MQSSILLCLIPAALCEAASPSPANVTISNATTANMACSGGVCAPTAPDAVLNVQDLEAMLASGNASVTTTGAGVQAKNIRINARLSWSTGSTLALDAYHSIEVNAKVTVAGTGGVSLTTNHGGTGGDFACNDNGRVQFNNLSGALTINGTPYLLVNNIRSLASAIAANPSGAFALARNYNAKTDGIYTSSPIPTTLTGSFNGLGNAISNLSIHDSMADSNVGFFAEAVGDVANVRLLNERLEAVFASSVGGLAGGAASVAHSFNSGNISGGRSSVVGGLVGEQSDSGSIERSFATGAVVCSSACGGLLGYASMYGSKFKIISQSYATGAVTSVRSWGSAGGLVGDTYSDCYYDCEIVNSYATGAVSGSAAGGLVGSDGWCFCHSIFSSYATGVVNSTSLAGGLVGFDQYQAGQRKHIRHAYWDMTTSGITDPGQGAANIANDPGIKGLSDAQMKAGLPKGFDPQIWKEDPNINGGLPYLIANPPAN